MLSKINETVAKLKGTCDIMGKFVADASLAYIPEVLTGDPGFVFLLK